MDRINVIDAYESARRDGADGQGTMPKERIREAIAILQKYRAGKKQLELRIRENEKWFRMQHWKSLREKTEVRQTGWLFASIANKHADFMDNRPEVTVLGRERGDEETARQLTKILPVVLRRGGWEDAYEEGCWDKLKFGGGVYAVTWDPAAAGGMGDVRLENCDGLNLFWEPGVEDLQNSRNLFYLRLVSHELLREAYPGNRELDRLGTPGMDVTRYEYEDNIDVSDASYVVDWYYKRRVGGRTVLHYCRFVEDVCLFSSEYSAGYEAGWYAHGQYPFVIDACFPDKGTPYGFGLIDAMKDTQSDIDEANDLMMRNMKQIAVRRYFSRNGGGVNEAEFADYRKEFVHVAGGLDEMNIREITATPLPVSYQNMLQSKIQELKENSFNRDVNAGGTGGTTTASGIAALQEAGSKTSRDMISRTYRAFRQICELTIELLRQFYEVPRYFRILGTEGGEDYAAFDASGLRGRPLAGDFGVEFGEKEPIFDLDVKVAKQNVWSRAAQNQDVINFFGMGFFDPARAQQALAALTVMELDNKDKLIEVITRSGMQQQFTAQVLPQLIALAQQTAPELGAAAAEAAAAAGLMEAPPAPARTATGGEKPAETDAAGNVRQQSAYMDRQRQIAADRSTPR